MAAPDKTIVPAEPGSVLHDAAAKGFKLDGDEQAPGTSKYYGTSAGGIKGYHDLPTPADANDVNLSVTNRTATGLTVGNTGGADAAIPPSTGLLAGLESAADKARHDEMAGALGGDLTGTLPSPALTTTGVTPGTYTLASLTVDGKGRVTDASNGAASGSPVFVTGTDYDGVSFGTGITVSKPGATGITVAIAAGTFPKTLAIPGVNDRVDGGDELQLTITVAGNPTVRQMLSLIPEVRYVDGSSNTGGIGDNATADEITNIGVGTITVQYINSGTIVPNAVAIVQFP